MEVTEGSASSFSLMSAQDIIDAINKHEVIIKYYAVQKSNGEIITFPDSITLQLNGNPSEFDGTLGLVQEYFWQSLAPDSLTLHLGPHARLEQITSENYDYVEREGDFLVDIEKGGFLSIVGHGFVLVGTNEYIEISSLIGGSLYAKTRNTNFGFSHISTMIDPSWKGFLQIGIGNLTAIEKRLAYLGPLCAVRFHRLASEAPQRILSDFRAAQPHFGSDWSTFRERNAEARFPMTEQVVYKQHLLSQLSKMEQEKKRVEEMRKKEKDEIELHGTRIKRLTVGSAAAGLTILASIFAWVWQLSSSNTKLDILGTLLDDSMTMALEARANVDQFANTLALTKTSVNRMRDETSRMTVLIGNIDKQFSQLVDEAGTVHQLEIELATLRHEFRQLTVVKTEEYHVWFNNERPTITLIIPVSRINDSRPGIILEVLGLPKNTIDYEIHDDEKNGVAVTLTYLGPLSNNIIVEAVIKAFLFYSALD